MSGKLVGTVQGSAAKPYEIRETDDPSVLWCSCPAWKHNKETPKTCKHIKGFSSAVLAAETEPSRTDLSGSDGGVGLPPSPFFVPMRLEQVDADDAQPYFEDDNWVVEQKVDGTRCVVTVTPDGTTFTSSNGKPLAHAASLLHTEKVAAALPHPLGMNYALDGELLWTGEFWAFDLVGLSGVDNATGITFEQRRSLLESLFVALDIGAPVFLLPQASGLADKLALLKSVHDSGGEGVVLKRKDAPYVPGTRATSQLKLKFTKTVDAIVTARNVGGKNNAELALYAPIPDGVLGVEVLTDIGSCSMNGKPDAQVGDVVEVKYLYATEDLHLYQPTLLRIRDDKEAVDCAIDQLTPVNKEIVQ